MSSKLHVFIDTNVFLSFFAYTNDDIEELKKLVGLMKNKKIRLYLTQQVCQEFARNREGKIMEAIANFGRVTTQGLPRLMLHYPEADIYQNAVKDLKKAHNEVIVRTKGDAIEDTLPADRLFVALTEASKPIVADDGNLKKARERTERNDPPGKERSFGDRLNWELLLAHVPVKTDLHIISQDGDFASSIDGMKPHPVLKSEWRERGSKLYLHTELKAFFKTHFPDIEVETDIEKRSAIERLKSSGSFAATHLAISGLQDFIILLTANEIDELVDAARTNHQVGRIGVDADVSSFYSRILETRLHRYPHEKQVEVREMFGISPVGAKASAS